MKFIKKNRLVILLIIVIVLILVAKIWLKDDTSVEKTSEKTEKETTEEISKQKGVLNEEVLKNYYKIDNKKDLDAFLATLTDEEAQALPEIDPNEKLNFLLPYENPIFVAEKYVGPNVILIKNKIENRKEAEKAVRNWLVNYIENSEEVVLVWH